MSIIAKVYEVEGEYMVAACEKSLLGKKFKEGKIVLEVKEDFYNGKEVCENELLELLNNATIANLVGEPVDLAIKHNLIDEDRIIKISGIKYAQIFVMR